MTRTVKLTVVTLSADVVDTTPMSGPPSCVPGGWVTVTATNGEITQEWRDLRGDEPRIGSTYTTTITEAK